MGGSRKRSHRPPATSSWRRLLTCLISNLMPTTTKRRLPRQHATWGKFAGTHEKHCVGYANSDGSLGRHPHSTTTLHNSTVVGRHIGIAYFYLQEVDSTSHVHSLFVSVSIINALMSGYVMKPEPTKVSKLWNGSRYS